MEETQGLKKINVCYLLGYILLPTAAVVLGAVLIFHLVEDPFMGPILILVLFMLAIFWWSFLGYALYERGEKKQLETLDEQGFIRSHTFSGSGCMVAVDTPHKQLAIRFRWNPGKTFILPASRITKVWVDDGCGGPGVLNGTCRVSVLFRADGKTIRMNTFRSNRRWSPYSGNVLTAISEADVMAEILNEASGAVR